MKIVTLQPHQWQQYRYLRLKALKEEPQAYASTYEENIKYPDDFWQKRLEKALKDQSQWLFFAVQEDNLVGMAGGFIKDEKDTAHIIAVYVLPEARRQGISRMLINTLITTIKRNKSIKKLRVGVNPEQIAALNLYGSFGFTIVKKEKIILGDSKEHESYEMEMFLDKAF